MNKLYKSLSLVTVFVLFAAAIAFQTQRSLAAAPAASLPYGLTIQDTMADVERKLGQPVLASAPQAGWEAGLPDEGASPDHFHYWAIYKRFGLTIVYNTPSAADKSATIYDLILNE